MRFSAVFISSAFVLASMSVALPIEREDMLVARFSDSDFLAEVEARAYDELYARGGSGLHKDYDTRIIHDDDEPFMPGFPNPPSQRTTSTKEPPLHPRLRTFNGRSMPDRDHRLHRDYDIRDPFEGLPKPASTNERPLHPRLRTFNGRSVPDMHHRDYDTRVLYEPRLPGLPIHPNQRTASTNEPPLHPRPHRFNGNGSPGRR
ncbi:hypothetical protein JOM56_003070 [Amanita muscaria]